MKSDTPICKANTYAASTGDADDYSPDFVPLEVAEKIERAANDLAVLLIAADTGEHPDIDGVEWHVAKEAALARFAELKK